LWGGEDKVEKPLRKKWIGAKNDQKKKDTPQR